MAKPLELLLKRFSFFENSCFFSIFNSPARPSAEFGLVDLRKLVVFCDFQIARATLCGVSRGRIAQFDFARVAEHRIRLLGNAVSLEEQTPVTAAHRAAFGHLVQAVVTDI